MTIPRQLFSLCCFCIVYGCSAQNLPDCQQTVRYNSLKQKLDPAICAPKGYQIMKVYDVDLTADSLKDKTIRWQKIELSDGDTVFYSIYQRTQDGKFLLVKTLHNLEPIYFKNYASGNGDKFYDSIKMIYSYPTLSEVELNKGSINIKFYIDASTIKQLVFSYSKPAQTWILSRERQWLAPTQYEEDRRLVFDNVSKEPMAIEEFNMLEYIGW